jgi:hypothetical protein
MLSAANLGGTFAAHAVWSISDGGSDGVNFHPMLAFITEDEKRVMERIVDDDLARAVDQGRARLSANPMDANDAALVYDGRMTVAGEKLDTIFIELRAYFSPKSEAILAVPYNPPSRGGLRVYRPKLIAWKDCDDFDVDAMFEAFWQGVDSHEHGSRIWNEVIDDSK